MIGADPDVNVRMKCHRRGQGLAIAFVAEKNPGDHIGAFCVRGCDRHPLPGAADRKLLAALLAHVLMSDWYSRSEGLIHTKLYDEPDKANLVF